MREEKHMEALDEVAATIQEALESGDILQHKRRLASMLSLGAQHAIELYLHKLKLIKPGAHIKHDWFLLGDRNLNLKISAIVTVPYSKVPHIDEIVMLAKNIEIDRNEILYGSPSLDEKKLREKIDNFLEIRKIADKGGTDES